MTIDLAFTLTLPRKILFGWDRVFEAPQEILRLGRRVLLVAGSRSQASGGAIERVAAAVRDAGAELLMRTGPGREPEVDDVENLLAETRGFRPDVIVGWGGGSTIDLAKALAALVPNAEGHRVTDFLEGTGSTLPLARDPLPLIAIPTTAGTGTEATRNAVLSWPQRHLKRSVRDERLVARVAIVDPALTCSMPPDVTAHAGMDAITQLIEAYVCLRANPATDALCLSALPRAFRALTAIVRGGGGRADRGDMAYAALVSGIALANAGLGVAHGVAPALGILHGVPHGKACAVLLPFALEVNREAAREKLAIVWRSLGETARDDDEAVTLLIERVRTLSNAFGIPARLRELGVEASRLGELCEYVSTNSLAANPRPLGKQELAALLASFI